MKGTSLFDIQKEIFEVLESDPLLIEMNVRVYDEVPENEDYPFIAMGEPSEERWDTFDIDGNEVNFPLNIWSDYEGWKELYLIYDRLNELLNYRQATLPDRNLVYFRIDNVATQKDLNRNIRGLFANYEIVTQYKP